MNIYLGEHFEQYIDVQIKSGRYKNASEVIREGLRNLEEREILLKKKIDEGILTKSIPWDVNKFLKMAHSRMDKIESK